MIYSAGLLAQAATFFVALASMQMGAPKSTFAEACLFTALVVNPCVFVINLIPQRNTRSALATDGWVLWKLFLHVFRGDPHPHPPIVIAPFEEAPVFPPETRLLEKPGFCPPGFVQGVEILNDQSTPMEFVVSILTKHLGLTEEDAILKMIEIHNAGGMLIALPSEERARAVADAVSQEARTAGHSFICRYAGILAVFHGETPLT